MYLLFFPVNNAYAFVFGSTIEDANLCNLHGFPMFYQTKGEAIEAARHRGLSVDLKTGLVSIDAKPDFDTASVLGGWQTRNKTDGTLIGPICNRTEDVWKWQEENLSPQMTIQRLVSDKATAAPTWRDTEYKTLKEARQANPNEYPSFFRRKA